MNRAILSIGVFLAALSCAAVAQTPAQYPGYPPQPGYQSGPGYQQQPVYQQPVYPPQPAYQQQAPPETARLSPQQLSNLVAPIALYPDMLLSEVLAASTYPLELVRAEQWMQNSPRLQGPALVDAAKQQNWDASVQALVAFPEVMNMLTRDVQWTTDLGNAFLAQQADVMDAIQQLRAVARNNGRLTDTAQQRVTVEQDNGQNAIVIQPTNPQVVYPPVYNPEYVWGPPVYGAYPPLAYPAPGYGIYYAVGTFLGALFTGLLSFGGWGWGLSWLTHGLFLNTLFFSHFGFHGGSGYGYYSRAGYANHAAWVHDPVHRLGVPYGNRNVAARYGGSYGNRGNNSFDSQTYRGNYDGRSLKVGRTGSFASDYQGSSRQMDAYRGLTMRESRGNSYNGGGSSYRGGNSGYDSARNSSFNYGGSRTYNDVAARGAYRNGYSASSSGGRGWSASSFRGSEARSSGSENSSRQFAAPKSSGRSGGREHSGGHGHSSGGHSHGGSHRK